MATENHLDTLKQGVGAWNRWRDRNLSITPDLSGAHLMKVDLSGVHLNNVHLSNAHLRGAYLINARLNGADLSGADLSGANLSGATLSEAILKKAYLRGAALKKANFSEARLLNADLTRADLSEADLSEANLSNATLTGADLTRANLTRANLSNATLTGANLTGADLTRADLDGTNFQSAMLTGATLIGATFIRTNLTNADLTQCKIFGSSAWDVRLENATQKDLVITDTDHEEPEITVDNLEVAQFIYLLLNNQKIRDVINTITSKVVLILGSFTDERKPILDALRDELRHYNFSPVVFDFEKPGSRNFTETISTLAHLSRFVIADLTNARSVPQELAHIVTQLPSVIIQPIIHRDDTEYAIFHDYKDRILEIYRYEDSSRLLASIKEHIIKPVEQKELEENKIKTLEGRLKTLEEKIKELEGEK